MDQHTTADIYERLNSIAIQQATQTQIMQQQAATSERQSQSIERIEHVLYGNGVAGLCEQVRELQEKEGRRTQIEKGMIGYIVNRVIPWIVSLAAVGYAAFFGAGK
jgi:hypothetical protein